MADLGDRRRRSGWRQVLGMALCMMSAAVPTRVFAGANFETGNGLLALCDANDNYGMAMCRGYIIGISDALNGNPVDEWKACIPVGGVIASQTQDIVIKWLRANPEKRHFAAPGLVAYALSQAFPCP